MRIDLSDLERLGGFAEALQRLFWLLLPVAFLAAVLGSAGTGLLLLILGAASFVVRTGLEDFIRSRRAPTRTRRRAEAEFTVRRSRPSRDARRSRPRKSAV